MLITWLITLFLTFFDGKKMLITLFCTNYVKTARIRKNCRKCTKTIKKQVEKSRIRIVKEKVKIKIYI